jgi:hypothetical protein
MRARNWKIHSLSLAPANEEEKTGGYPLQPHGLNKHQEESDHRVLDPIFTKHRFEPVAQKMKNEEEVERNKEAVDDQLDKEICKGMFSGPFHSRLSW